MARQAKKLLTFEDVTVFLSRAEWDALPAAQRELYRDVVSDTYELLTSLGYPGPKPDILHRLERGEEPWICPSPGHTGSWLDKPSSGWWPRASRYQGLETSCSAGWSTSWRLQDRKFQKKFGCHKGRSKFPSEADSRVGSQAQPWLKEEVEYISGLMEDLTQSDTFLLHSTPEQQSLDLWEQLWARPWERNHGHAQTHFHTSGEQLLQLEDLQAAAAKDHNYCLRSWPGAARPCSLREHNYSQQRCALRGPGAGGALAVRHRLARRRSRCGRTLRRAREILRRYRPYRRPACPGRGCCGCRSTARSTAQGMVQGTVQGTAQGTVWGMVQGTAQGTAPGECRPTEAAAPQEAGSAECHTPCAPQGGVGSGGSPSAPVPAEGARKGGNPPGDAGAKRAMERRMRSLKSNGLSLQEVFRDVLRAVGYMLDSICRKLELQGLSQGNSIWPIVIQIDNLAEIGKL